MATPIASASAAMGKSPNSPRSRCDGRRTFFSRAGSSFGSRRWIGWPRDWGGREHRSE